jgi:hypothetical protein
MTQLSALQPADAALLISLVYKVGIWVSHADDVDGERDDEREIQALESGIRAIAKLHENKPFTSEIAREALKRKSDWAKWTDESMSAPNDARRAVKLLQSAVSEAESKDYRAFLMEIAGAVARAHGEFGAFDDEPEGGIAGLMGKIASGFKGMASDDKNHPMNVSAAEDSALSTLAAALKD